MLEIGGMFLKVIWMYLFQLPGTIILWLMNGTRKTLDRTYKENMMASGIIGLFFLAILSFLIFKGIKLS